LEVDIPEDQDSVYGNGVELNSLNLVIAPPTGGQPGNGKALGLLADDGLGVLGGPGLLVPLEKV
jgi:hypothetical protein